MERLGKTINRLAILNRQNSNIRLKKYGIFDNEASLLMYLSKNDNVKQDDIVKEFQIDKSAVTRLLKKMEEKGLIIRVKNDNDHRSFQVSMSELGKRKQKLVDNTFEQKEIDLLNNISENELKELRRLLMILEDNLKGGNYEE